MTRDLRLVLHFDGREVCLDHAQLADDQPLTARGLVRGMRACADKIEQRVDTKEEFDLITEGLDDLGETA